MKIHYFQHVPFEGLAAIEPWATAQGHTLSSTQLFADAPLPAVHTLDWLIILGGPMNIYETKRYPWLASEQRCIEQAIQQGKTVLGICLGAQLIADVLGARVTRNEFTEIGWFPVHLTEQAASSALAGLLPPQFNALHWHGDTFDLPPGAVHIAQSAACQNQAFAYGEKVLGLQFHLEATQASAQKMIEHCGDDFTEGKYIEQPSAILAHDDNFKQANLLMRQILQHLSDQGSL